MKNLQGKVRFYKKSKGGEAELIMKTKLNPEIQE